MVLSQIDKSIEYPSAKFVDSEDLDYDAQLYQIELFPDLEVIIALGKVKYTFIDKNVLYIPVYLTNDGEVILQMGVYEFPSNIYTSLLDEDNDFDISLLENPLPLLYKFINESFIRKELGEKKTPVKPPAKIPTPPTEGEMEKEPVEDATKESPEDATKESPEPKKSPSDDFTELSEDSRVPNKETIIQELFAEDDDERPIISDDVVAGEDDQETKFKEHSGHNWVEKFMKNENYGIVDNEGGGDCLFATIRDAYSGTGKSATVEDLRTIASNAATEEVFRNFKEQYDMYHTEVKTLSTELAQLQTTNMELKKQYSQTKDRDEKKNLVDKSKPIIDKFKQTKKEKKAASELLHEYRWMRGIDTLDKLKKKMRTCRFWAESWTIQTLEMILNVKLIILSSYNYEHRDYDNVLSCGDMAPDSMEKKGAFKPKYYIILDHTGNHYKLITYKQKQIFEFNDIPVKIKKLIVDKCMESKGKNMYNYIPKFKLLQMSMKDPHTSSLSPGDDAGPEDQGDPLKEQEDEGSDLSKKPVFDETTVFQFYSKSADKQLPGKGAGETIEPRNIKNFANLASMPGWRKVLSNFYMGPFKLDNRTWNSVEHYYHANKFKKGHPEFYQQFTVESGTDISKDPAFAKAAGGKTGKYKKKDWKRPKEIVIDEDFFSSGRNQQVMEAGQRAKYSQNEVAKDVLLATKDAKLQHHVRGQPPIVFYDSMKIREELKN
uniref:NADAR domain-containing protein n=1 Tax=viral metagenome TaxID=1070528 RepID=A0A6C0EMN1_9ZZZZ